MLDPTLLPQCGVSDLDPPCPLPTGSTKPPAASYRVIDTDPRYHNLQLQCIVSSLNSSACAAANQTCLCADQHYTHIVETCVLASCDVRQALAVKNATWSGCGFPTHNADASMIGANVVCIVLIVTFFGLRMLSRAVKIAPWGWDDTTITIAFVRRVLPSLLSAAYYLL